MQVLGLPENTCCPIDDRLDISGDLLPLFKDCDGRTVENASAERKWGSRFSFTTIQNSIFRVL